MSHLEKHVREESLEGSYFRWPRLTGIHACPRSPEEVTMGGGWLWNLKSEAAEEDDREVI